MTPDLLVARFVVEGDPVPKERARTFRDPRSGRMVSKSAPRTVEWERRVAVAAWGARVAPAEELLRVRMVFYRATRQVCDVDNLVKAVKDALNGVVWLDDRQVMDLSASKRISGARPRVEVDVWRLSPVELAALVETPPAPRTSSKAAGKAQLRPAVQRVCLPSSAPRR